MTPGRIHLPIEPTLLAFCPIHIQTAHGKGTGDHPWIASLHATDSPITNVSLLSSNIHWASKETYNFFRVTLTKIHSNKLDHNWTKFVLLSIFENANVCSSKKGEKCGEIAKGNFSKITEAAWFLSSEIATDKSQYGCYISHHWMFWIGS